MNSILAKLFSKRGIKDFNELDKEEKQQFETWQKVLSKDELTTDDIKKFCETQCELIETKWRDLDTPQNKKSEWIAYHVVYSTLLQVINSPKLARENLEKYLNEIIMKQ